MTEDSIVDRETDLSRKTHQQTFQLLVGSLWGLFTVCRNWKEDRRSQGSGSVSGKSWVIVAILGRLVVGGTLMTLLGSFLKAY